MNASILPCQNSNRCVQEWKLGLGFENIFVAPFSIDYNGKITVQTIAGLWLQAIMCGGLKPSSCLLQPSHFFKITLKKTSFTLFQQALCLFLSSVKIKQLFGNLESDMPSDLGNFSHISAAGTVLLRARFIHQYILPSTALKEDHRRGLRVGVFLKGIPCYL